MESIEKVPLRIEHGLLLETRLDKKLRGVAYLDLVQRIHTAAGGKVYLVAEAKIFPAFFGIPCVIGSLVVSRFQMHMVVRVEAGHTLVFGHLDRVLILADGGDDAVVIECVFVHSFSPFCFSSLSCRQGGFPPFQQPASQSQGLSGH